MSVVGELMDVILILFVKIYLEVGNVCVIVGGIYIYLMFVYLYVKMWMSV